jgi:hypothetical protein
MFICDMLRGTLGDLYGGMRKSKVAIQKTDSHSGRRAAWQPCARLQVETLTPCSFAVDMQISAFSTHELSPPCEEESKQEMEERVKDCLSVSQSVM